MKEVKALVLSGYGLNCDYETAYALELAGATAVRVHINSLVSGMVRLEDFQIMVFGGGFSWGDDHGAGVIQAVRIKTKLGGNLLKFIENQGLILGICNGFQTLVNLGLLPGFDLFKKDIKPQSSMKRLVALINNDSGNFRDQWVNLKIDSDSPCIFTKDLDSMELPVRHGEGKFYSDDLTIKRLIAGRQVVARYAMPDGSPAEKKFPLNPNGSEYDIAGICDPTGRIFGLMPHPEAFNHPTNHPDWTLNREKTKRKHNADSLTSVSGIKIFQNAVDFIRKI